MKLLPCCYHAVTPAVSSTQSCLPTWPANAFPKLHRTALHPPSTSKCIVLPVVYTCAAAGSIKSFQKAFEWRKFLVQRLLGKADKTPALFERTCECLQSLGLLLEDHSCRGGTTPQLQGCDSHLLAVGAYMTGMRQIDANSAIMAWLRSHIQVLLHSHNAQMYCIFLGQVHQMLGTFSELCEVVYSLVEPRQDVHLGYTQLQKSQPC